MGPKPVVVPKISPKKTVVAPKIEETIVHHHQPLTLLHKNLPTTVPKVTKPVIKPVIVPHVTKPITTPNVHHMPKSTILNSKLSPYKSLAYPSYTKT